MVIGEGDELQTKGTGNIFNKIIVENFTNLKTEMPVQAEEITRTQNRHN
jgi:hypothetical protein